MQSEPLTEMLKPLFDATGAVVVAADDARPGDIALVHDGSTLHVRLPHLDGVLARLIALVERDLGGPLAEISREDKQQAVARLHDLGAFNLRKSVEDIAVALGVSRFTVYNYLDRIDVE